MKPKRGLHKSDKKKRASMEQYQVILIQHTSNQLFRWKGESEYLNYLKIQQPKIFQIDKSHQQSDQRSSTNPKQDKKSYLRISYSNSIKMKEKILKTSQRKKTLHTKGQQLEFVWKFHSNRIHRSERYKNSKCVDA